MDIAYVDTSCLVSIAFGESGSTAISRRLHSFDTLASSNLMEAEFLATLARERRDQDRSFLSKIAWIIPDRPLHSEITRVLAGGYLRGADCWHLACALYFAEAPGSLSFLTLDARQRSAAEMLGFRK